MKRAYIDQLSTFFYKDVLKLESHTCEFTDDNGLKALIWLNDLGEIDWPQNHPENFIQGPGIILEPEDDTDNPVVSAFFVKKNILSRSFMEAVRTTNYGRWWFKNGILIPEASNPVVITDTLNAEATNSGIITTITYKSDDGSIIKEFLTEDEDPDFKLHGKIKDIIVNEKHLKDSDLEQYKRINVYDLAPKIDKYIEAVKSGNVKMIRDPMRSAFTYYDEEEELRLLKEEIENFYI